MCIVTLLHRTDTKGHILYTKPLRKRSVLREIQVGVSRKLWDDSDISKTVRKELVGR